MANSYTAKDITVLEGLEPVRRRPGMYIGGVGPAGLHHLVWEIIDNAIDEAMNGHAARIGVTLHKLARVLAGELAELSDALVQDEQRTLLAGDDA